MSRFYLVVFGCYKVQCITKEEFIAITIHVKMQCYHLYITHHVTKVTNATTTYQAKHNIIDSDMV